MGKEAGSGRSAGRVARTRLVVSAPLTALGGWAPRVLLVTELALLELVEPRLLSPEHIQLVLAFQCIELHRVDRRFLAVLRGFSLEQSSQ